MGIVRVYKNLHRNCYSVQTNRPLVGWRLAFHTTYLRLTNVSFKVYENGRQKVLLNRHKTVHAFIVGTLDSHEFGWYNLDNLQRVTYNPYQFRHFYRCDDYLPVESLAVAYLTTTGVYGR